MFANGNDGLGFRTERLRRGYFLPGSPSWSKFPHAEIPDGFHTNGKVLASVGQKLDGLFSELFGIIRMGYNR